MSAKDRLREVMRGGGMSYQQTADALYVSLDTVKAWLKPSRNDPPEMAIELLALKTGQPYRRGLIDRAAGAEPVVGD